MNLAEAVVCDYVFCFQELGSDENKDQQRPRRLRLIRIPTCLNERTPVPSKYMTNAEILLPEIVAQRIHLVRGHKVMLDEDLAALYQVATRVLVQAIGRNARRFPPEFMFQLTDDEWSALRSQNVISKGRGGRRYAPYAFTEHGALMLSSVLKSDTAADVGIVIVKTFVQLREMLSTNKELAAKLMELDRKVSGHDQAIAGLINTIRQLMAAPQEQTRPIGFVQPGKASK